MMAYHSLVGFLEAPFGKSPRERLASAVHGALRCDMPYARLRAAGQALMSSRPSEGATERLINEHIDFDANPFMLCALTAQSPASAIALHAALNQRANFALRTFVALGSDGGLRIAQRDANFEGDLPICRDTHVAAFAAVISRLPKAGAIALPAPKLSSLCDKLGLERCAARDVALALEEEPGLKIGRIAKLLGANARALERWLRMDGLTPMAVKRASMLIRATSLLRTEMSLTEVAHESGYADLSHMSRAFATSCALTPTQLRACVGGGRDAINAPAHLRASNGARSLH